MTTTQHTPVLLEECLDGLDLQPGKIVADGTLGGAGHARRIAEAVAPDGLMIGLDRDTAALDRAETLLRQAALPFRLAGANFCDLPEVLEALEMEMPALDGVLLDLGLSSDQLADTNRGFSFQDDGPLDLRFDTSTGEPAARLIERLSESHLADLIYAYGEERASRRIARAIVQHRKQEPIRTSRQLAELLSRTVRLSPADRDRIHPATRTFQALRIAVNDELKSLEIALRRIPECVRPGGRIAIISFHSLEDRRVKSAFRDDERYTVLTKKPIRPNQAELARNPRARSAKLRVAERSSIDSADRGGLKTD